MTAHAGEGGGPIVCVFQSTLKTIPNIVGKTLLLQAISLQPLFEVRELVLWSGREVLDIVFEVPRGRQRLTADCGLASRCEQRRDESQSHQCQSSCNLRSHGYVLCPYGWVSMTAVFRTTALDVSTDTIGLFGQNFVFFQGVHEPQELPVHQAEVGQGKAPRTARTWD